MIGSLASIPFQEQAVVRPFSGTASGPQGEVSAASEAFESVFLSTLLKPIFEELSENSSMGGGSAETTWAGMLASEYAGEMARSGGIGIAQAVARELIALQETQP